MNSGTTLTDRLTREIVATIHEQQLAPGAALPSARALAERFEVTLPTVREALRRLEATDAIELRHGSGTYVGTSFDRRILVNPYYDPADLEASIELIDARIVIEPGIARLAATAHTPQLLADLEAAMDNALKPESTGPRKHFHTVLAAATGNRALRETVESLLAIHQRAQRVARSSYQRDHDLNEHRGIVEAVRAGDGALAAQLTEDHLLSIRKSLTSTQDKI